MKTVTVGANAYRMSNVLTQITLDMARDAMAGKYGIYAIIKGDFIQMQKLEYPDQKALQKAVQQYRKQGFLAKFTQGGPPT